MAAATAALASRFASSRDFVGIWVGRGAARFADASACACLVRGASLAVFDCEVPLTGALGLAAGLMMGTAGMIRPLFGTVCAGLAAVGASLATVGAGGAKASATLGFDSVGGGGQFWVTTGAGVVDELGSLTVAAGFSIRTSCWGAVDWALIGDCSAAVSGFDAWPRCIGGWPGGPNGPGGG